MGVPADLLTHHPFVRDEDAKPVAYNRVDWWDHPPGIDVVVGKRYRYKINSSQCTSVHVAIRITESPAAVSVSIKLSVPA